MSKPFRTPPQPKCMGGVATSIGLKEITKSNVRHQNTSRKDVVLLDHFDLKTIKQFMDKTQQSKNCWEWLGTTDSSGYGHLLSGNNIYVIKNQRICKKCNRIRQNKLYYKKLKNIFLKPTPIYSNGKYG